MDFTFQPPVGDVIRFLPEPQKHQCVCTGIDEKSPCIAAMTQEDLLCDGCRTVCTGEAMRIARDVYHREGDLVAAYRARNLYLDERRSI